MIIIDTGRNSTSNYRAPLIDVNMMLMRLMRVDANTILTNIDITFTTAASLSIELLTRAFHSDPDHDILLALC